MKPKILVIDDEIGVIEMIENHFSLRGYEVFSAQDGSKGIEVCGRVNPDVILLDIKMKNLDGDKALPELRKLAPAAKIFVISAYQDEIVKRRIAGLGADAYFEKPASIIELEKTIRNSLWSKKND